MNEINFYNALSSDLNALLNQTKNIVSNEEFVYVNQKGQSNSIFNSNSDAGDYES